MNGRVERYTVLRTPGFIAQMRAAPAVDDVAAEALRVLLAGGEPSWVVGDPEADARRLDDGGRTLRVPAPVRFWAIRDDHDEGCACGCTGARAVVTFLLPEEY